MSSSEDRKAHVEAVISAAARWGWDQAQQASTYSEPEVIWDEANRPWIVGRADALPHHCGCATGGTCDVPYTHGARGPGDSANCPGTVAHSAIGRSERNGV